MRLLLPSLRSFPAPVSVITAAVVLSVGAAGRAVAADWSRNVQRELGAGIPQWGLSGSPLVEGRLLILNVGDGGVRLSRRSSISRAIIA